MKTEKDIIEYRLLKSDTAFEDAQSLAQLNRWDLVNNRLYYAAYYAVSALLFQSGKIVKTHSGLKNRFHQKYIKEGKMVLQMGSTYETLYHNRHDADYSDFAVYTEEDVQPLMDETKVLLIEIKKFITI